MDLDTVDVDNGPGLHELGHCVKLDNMNLDIVAMWDGVVVNMTTVDLGTA